MGEQAQFIEDLRDLVKDVERLVEGCLLDEIKEILTKLFGEEPTGAAVDAYAERIGESIRTGKGRHETGSGRIVVPAASVAGVVASPTPARATPPHRFHGDQVGTMSLSIQRQVERMQDDWPHFRLSNRPGSSCVGRGRSGPTHSAMTSGSHCFGSEEVVAGTTD